MDFRGIVRYGKDRTKPTKNSNKTSKPKVMTLMKYCRPCVHSVQLNQIVNRPCLRNRDLIKNDCHKNRECEQLNKTRVAVSTIKLDN